MEINRHNFKEKLLLMLDDELSPAEKIQVEAYMLLHEDAAQEWKLLQKTKLKPAAAPAFPRMAMLLKDEAEETVVAKLPSVNTTVNQNAGGRGKLFYWSAAAGIAAVLTVFSLLNNSKNNNNSVAFEQEKANTSVTNNKESHISTPEKMLQADKTNTEIKPADVKEHKSKAKAFPGNAIYAKTKGKAFPGNGLYVSKKQERIISDEHITNTAEPLMAMVEMQDIWVENHDKSTAKLNRKVKRMMAANMHKNWKQENTFENAFASAEDETGKGLVSGLINFFTKTLTVEKKEINDEKFYAITLETDKISISKTFRSNF